MLPGWLKPEKEQPRGPVLLAAGQEPLREPDTGHDLSDIFAVSRVAILWCIIRDNEVENKNKATRADHECTARVGMKKTDTTTAYENRRACIAMEVERKEETQRNINKNSRSMSLWLERNEY